MKKSARLVLAATVAITGLASAAPAIAMPSNLDQYGCRTENSGYRCYAGDQDGRIYKNRDDMLSTMNAATNAGMRANAYGPSGMAATGPGVINNGTGGNHAGGGAKQNTPSSPGPGSRGM